MTHERKEELERNREANLTLYSDYNKTLRAWLVAYGIALPALFITSKDAKAFLSGLECHTFIVQVFLLGLTAQIGIAFINKFVSWSAYHRDDLELSNSNCNKFINWVASFENSIWVDFVLDLISILAFGVATVMLVIGLAQ